MNILKPFDEVYKAIQSSTSLKHIQVCMNMLKSRRDFISNDDYKLLTDEIVYKMSNFKKKVINN